MIEPKVAIVHDYLNQMGGAERVVGVLHKMFPDAPIYTTIAAREKLLPELQDASIRTTWMQRIPRIQSRFKLFFWLFPFAVRSMDLSGYDIVISSSSAYAKGLIKGKNSVHLCYCHAPMRFAWDFDGYMRESGLPRWLLAAVKACTLPLRSWDRRNSRKVDRIIANSTVVKDRIKRFYGVDAPVVYPPVQIERFAVADEPPDEYYLVVSRLVSYKRIDLAVEACTATGRKLIVIGDGDDRRRLEALAGPSVVFLGRRSDEEVVRYLQRCQALLFPGLEDFGIVPLEANGCGRPVIAFQAGGALDTIVPDQNGLYFEEQTVTSLVRALERFEAKAWDPAAIRRHAEKYNERIFAERLLDYLDRAVKLRSS
ncbi:glycosyltransferase [Paenibacillus sp. NPDC058071]|uniref:glycosyltransferase n=1 Tax=Paenibacillus sp. NPDC058071 TaxID=3346326 RepID=UPI0036DF52D1